MRSSWWRRGAVGGEALLLGLALEACRVGGGVQAPGGPSGAASGGVAEGGDAGPGWSVRESVGRPRAVSVERLGDGQAGVAVAVAQAGGLVAHTALAALVEGRLRAAGLEALGVGDRDGFRVAVGAPDAAAVERATRLLVEALQRPVGPDETGPVKLAAARVGKLRTQAFADAPLGTLARCTGEPSPGPGEPLPELSGAAGVSQVEGWRRAIGASQVAFGFVGAGAAIGPGPVVIGGTSGWAAGKALEGEKVPGETTAVVSTTEAHRGRLSVAVWFDEPAAGPAAAQRLGQGDGALAGRLAALGPLGVTRVVGVARPGGSCALVSVDGVSPHDASGRDAARAAMVLRQELVRAAGEGPRGADEAPAIVRRVGDPREAAGAAAWWSMAGRGAQGTQTRVVFEASHDVGSRDDRTPRLGSAWRELEREPAVKVETRAASEVGQGVLRVLLASACPVAEGPGEHGVTALVLRSLGRRGGEVTVTPWLAADGAGVMASGARRPGETSEAWGARVADEAARALLGAAPDANEVLERRGEMLGQTASDWPAALWNALAPEQPGRLWPAGSPDGVARQNAETVRLRWERLAASPLRLAVLATSAGPGQVASAAQAVERWMAPGTRACPAVAAPGAAASGSLPGGVERAYVAWRVDASGGGVGSAAATALLLGGPQGVLGPALEGTGVSAQAVVVGQGADAALVVELRGARDGLEGAIDRSKGVVERLESLIDGPDGAQALGRWGELEREAQLDPGARLGAVWRGQVRPAVPAVADWKRWVSAQVSAGRAVVLRPGR